MENNNPYKINIDQFIINTAFFLIYIKIIFSYLLVELSYFQKHFISNFEKYNFLSLPKEFSTQIELVLLPLLVIYLVKNFKYCNEEIRTLIYLSFLAYFLNLITCIINKSSILEAINYSLKVFLPIYFFIALIIQHTKYRLDLKKSLIRIILLCFSLLIIGLLFFDPSFNRLQFYLPVFFSGNHTHSYILVFCSIGVSYLLYKKGFKKATLIFMMLSFIFLLIGYNIRTALLCYLIFIMTMLFIIHDIFKVFIFKVIFFILPIGIVLFYIKYNFDFDEFSSGRLSMYIKKFSILAEKGILDLLFGSGFGSDLIVIDTWWWDKKGSHSDLITYVIENGIVYLLCFIIYLMVLFILPKKINLIYSSLVIGYFISCVISNGVTSRPLTAYVFFTLLALIYSDILMSDKNLSKSKFNSKESTQKLL